MIKTSQRGFSVLEQAMVLPVLLLIVAGAFDINTLLQGYSALQEGVTASLRCVYTSDGKCVATQPDLRPRLFNYYRVNRSAEYLTDLFDFRGVTSWIDQPRYRYSNFTATVLGNVEYDQPTANLRIRQKYYPADRTARFTLRTATFPYILNSARNPTLRYRGASINQVAVPQGSYAPHVYSATSVRLQSDGPGGGVDDVADDFYFSAIPAPSERVLTSSLLEYPIGANHTPNFNANFASSSEVQVAVHITGDKGDTTVGSLGGVSIDLQRRNSNGEWVLVRSLGAQQLGRQPGESSSANFVIRGLPIEFIDQDSVTDYSELHDYSPIILRYGQSYRIHFALVRTAGAVGWQAHQVRIFYPDDLVNQSKVIACLNPLSPCSAPSSCQLGENLPAEILDATVNIHESESPTLGASLLLASCSPGHGTIDDLLTAQGIALCARAYEVQADTASCAAVVESRSCAAIGPSNRGVPQSPSADGKLRGSPEALSSCPPPEDSAAGPAQSPRWSVVNAVVPNEEIAPGSDGTLIQLKETCSQAPSWPSGSQLGSYPHLAYSRDLQDYVPHYTGSNDPAQIKRNPTGEYSCSEFPLHEQSVDVTPMTRTTLNQSSLFFGEHLKPGCNWQEVLHQDGIKHELIPAQAYFAAEPPLATGRKARSSSEPDLCVDPSPEIVWGDPEGQQLISGGPFPEQNPPVECQQTGVSCRAEFAGFGPGSQGGVQYNFRTAAQHFGFNEIQAHYPAVRWDCNGKHCAKLSVQEDGPFMSANGSLQVPLYVLGSGTVELRYAGRQRKEAEFSR